MKATSIKQPWVYAILHEGKDIENRSWQRNYPKPLVPHGVPQPGFWHPTF